MNVNHEKGTAAQLVPGLYADYLPPALMDRERDYFGYSVTELNLAAAAVATPTFAVQNDSDFLITAICGTARNPAAPTVVFATPAITLQVDDAGAGRNLFNQAVDWRNLCGSAELAFVLPYPKLINRASTVTVTLTNLDAAQAYDVRVTFHGFKIFTWKRGT